MSSKNDRVSERYPRLRHDTHEHDIDMFIEDFGRNVVPIYGSKAEELTCKIDPDNKEIMKSLHELLPTNGLYYRPSFKEMILESIEYIARHIVNQGILVLELVKYNDENKRTYYKLETVYGKAIKIRRNRITQIIPDHVAEDIGKDRINIPREKCFVFEFPVSLGGKKKYIEFLREFRKLASQSPMMKLWNSPLQALDGYNYTEHQRIHDIELWKITKRYHWHHRARAGEEISGFYYIYRHLLFRKNQVKLRDYVVEELCKMVSTLSGSLYGQKVELKIEGLMSIDKVEEKLEQLKTGQLDTKTIRDVL